MRLRLGAYTFQKVDAETAREWQLSNADGKLKSMEQLRKFLERRARALEASGRSLEATGEITREKKSKDNPAEVISQFNVLSFV